MARAETDAKAAQADTGTGAGALDGRVALVTGGARGIGEGAARALHAAGAHVVIADVADKHGAALAAALGDLARFVHLDVSDETAWARTVKDVVADLGTVDVLVNNAGIANMAPIEKFTTARWDAVLAVNLTGVFLGCRTVVPVMKAQGRGSIINVSSVDGLRGSPAVHAYTAAKFGVRGLSKSLAVELGEFGIRVNSVHPGYVRTRMTSRIDPDHLDIPLRRAGRAAEIADTIVFLASDASSYTTGAELVVDGGLVAGIPRR
ncbi:SDR family oxidoreductase [Oerskovia sp. KBS0722]|uniref:SDR family oxidoreductase n=1 Tax=Oerskovia sp. KBS0722 TaxID=1179673 RepID=UPI00110F0788|nr:SDR family oxidoreductase [Oerskovia sp. KBS0722]QDW61991.1 SDR family oxidoreductase [Oerskovia sp. KBS0722]